MKGKLIKENDYHYYLSIDGKIIADINAHPLSSINVSKLSKQNCDEIFGVVDVEVEMEYVGECNGNNDEGCFQDSPGHNCGCFERRLKLDADGCLILKRI